MHQRTRVRSGCSVCKTRRVKCDETKPYCARCTSTGRACSGYGTPPPPTRTKPRRSKYGCLPTPPVVGSLSHGTPGPRYASDPPSGGPARPLAILPKTASSGIDADESRSFEYFRSRVSKDVAGYFDADFWHALVLQAGAVEPTVWHAILALSSLYEATETWRTAHGSASSDRHQYLMRFAIKHYNRAVGILSSRIGTTGPSLEVVLISCLIFIWLEFLQDHVDTALNHLQSGLRIVAGQTHLVDSQDTMSQLARHFTRLHIQASLHGSPKANFDHSAIIGNADSQCITPLAFSTIVEARTSLDSKLNHVFLFHRQIEKPGFAAAQRRKYPFPDPQSLECLTQAHVQSLQKWETAFQALNARLSTATLPIEERQAMYQLELQYLLVTNTLRTLFATTPMIFDAFNDDYARMVCLSRQMLCRSASAVTLPFDTSIQGPLFYVVLKCRYLPVRREAVRLLLLCPEYEGIWQRASLLEFCNWKIAAEERRRPAWMWEHDPLPEHARIYAEKAREAMVDGRRVTMISYKRGVSKGVGDVEPDEEEMTGLSMRLAGLIGT